MAKKTNATLVTLALDLKIAENNSSKVTEADLEEEVHTVAVVLEGALKLAAMVVNNLLVEAVMVASLLLLLLVDTVVNKLVDMEAKLVELLLDMVVKDMKNQNQSHTSLLTRWMMDTETTISTLKMQTIMERKKAATDIEMLTVCTEK